MNSTDFTYILQHPQTVTPQQTRDVKSIIDRYPYFQAARALYLKGLKNQESPNYNQELKITASYTTDRSILFDFITSEAFTQNEISKFIKRHKSQLLDIPVVAKDISVDKSIALDYILNQQVEDANSVFNPALFQPKTPLNNPSLDNLKTPESPTSLPKQELLDAEAILKIGQPLEFNKKENHSFNEWLKLTRFEPIHREAPKDIPVKTEKTEDIAPKNSSPDALEREKKFKLIDKFISKNPKIPSVKTYVPSGNIAKDRMIEPETLMTETLARIYVEQKNYKKAIQSYKILSLKYPEKSSFFAIQIKAVELLQEQNNKS
ncbi:hypothetical protein ACFFU9_03835 [Mariniflexile ostreae]|uniref:Tetratricopeptide repeat protein n=1 Tax=Mariniflexile ostreae TaxID=1520892 RepID=A0ABV5F8W8_9FLAO